MKKVIAHIILSPVYIVFGILAILFLPIGLFMWTGHWAFEQVGAQWRKFDGSCEDDFIDI